MADQGERLRDVLAPLVDGRRRWGAAVVSRDGIAVASQFARPASEDSFAAMAAAALGAAEAALQEWADDRPLRASVEGKTVRISLQGLDADHFLAVAMPLTAAPDPAGTIELEAAAGRLRDVLRGVLVPA